MAISQPASLPPCESQSVSNLALITLDLDETVWPSKAVLRKAEETQFKWLQQQAPYLTAKHDLESLRSHRRFIRERYTEIAYDLTAVRTASLRLLLEEFGYSPGLAEEAIAIFLEARNWVTPYTDVPPVLEKLARTYRLASLTNGNADVQYTPLKAHFHFSLTPAIAGAAKPAPDMFYRALEQAGAEPHQAVHVGDHPECDIIAAQQVGMRAVWINRLETPWPADLPPPEATIKNFHEFEQWLLQETKTQKPSANLF
ncbi:HAD-superfamily hydrolase subfamily IA, variant 3 [Nitrosococcus oceani ATCC 19707]|uniref:HAD-superfamily hydrolase subfamily IA, variant 3 n=2 Tax=Nitrosococcus oceani TaxID=1229 RepID=Q3J9G1_NITOC|nr:HAD family hydrolase [Nitrosococcus oceani]ABA58535.1 HAD-superfamily hydrolase subfamily IA, variant 3 [Nitrosococcus oceani ATCC 19707]EDZ66980.1 haloacid dehalogenase-like hydrolase, putative [Nitrosococcus oceani AFC27]KFI19018.1 HAD family hydrolase [Nitrosococcus oceani C-27]GEM19654.1 haloacid dehalogenase [Nitrosococcus oceani]